MNGVPGVMVLLSHACPLSSFSGSLMPCGRRAAACVNSPVLRLRARLAARARQTCAGGVSAEDERGALQTEMQERWFRGHLFGHVGAEARFLLGGLLPLLRRPEPPRALLVHLRPRRHAVCGQARKR